MAVALLVVVLIAMSILLGGGWYLSGAIKTQVLDCNWQNPPPDLQVTDIIDGRITLVTTQQINRHSDWREKGTYGLEGAGGYDQVGDILDDSDDGVVREFLIRDGSTAVGNRVRLDHFAFPGDPEKAFGLSFEEVSFRSADESMKGDFPAWLIDGSSDTWVIVVHGRRAGRREALRMLPLAAELGLPSLTITYRNDFWAPKTEDCLYRYGQTEWKDLEGAVRYAVGQGGKHVILVGYSYGGAIIMNFLYESSYPKEPSQAGTVSGIILDSPMLDLNAVIDRVAQQRQIPRPLLISGKTFARLRFDIDWGKLDYLRRADELTVPVLLFHGDGDDEVPVKTSDNLAEQRPDIVRYVRVSGGAHARSWNMDTANYEAEVRDFLRDLAQ